MNGAVPKLLVNVIGNADALSVGGGVLKSASVVVT